MPSIRLIVALVALGCFCSIAGEFTNASQRVTSIVPFASAVAYAVAHKIPIDGIDPLVDSDSVTRGDSVTVLVTLAEKGRQRQWLLFTQIAGAPKTNKGGMTIYNSFGNQFEFPSRPTPVTLRTIGPFFGDTKGKAAKIADERTSFELDKGFLGLGLDEAAAAFARKDQSKTNRGHFGSGTRKFTEAEIKKSKASAAAADWNLTMAEQRAFGGTFPALTSYFTVVQHTDSLSDILSEVVDRPSLLSLAANLGISSVGFNWQAAHRSPLPTSAWGLKSEAAIYEIPIVLELNKHPSLFITMLVTRPQPPLLTSAGIIGVLAEKPGKAEPFLTIRVISARRTK